ncbi:thermonuclease family protein [uncultured Methanobrevibacter sp.]|uniref:thermonuclease family protein n=1 Tax=uncultured Methanobrevibacter sp. TaxID=253161 RepID=UPI0025FAAB1C|nr:thermonuclease family protein [uncultured Methanobrevibacter sp.]MCI6994514.1 thermonuclease family protein [Methanobrevibacter sp.]
MNKKTISLILLIIFLITAVFTAVNSLISDENPVESQTGTLIINNENISYEKTGKCIEVIDGNTIQVYGIGKVQLTQIGNPHADAKKFVEENCLGKTVYLDIDDKKPEDNYGRTLAIVYTDSIDINKELINNNLSEISYFTPSEFEKGEI